MSILPNTKTALITISQYVKDERPCRRIDLRAHLSHQLSVDLGDTVDCPRSLHTKIWRRVTWGSRTKGTDGAGDKQAEAVLCSDVQDVV